ncbi:MAG: ParB N-terminal domain-containing protein [Euryarchaeota archaeon]|nr:ParB N-terminal domain-containing protein [Euryarchaeota archaeon]
MWDEEDVELVPYQWLKPHEQIKPRNRDKLLEMTKRWGGFTKPLIVDKRTGAILDGHHRYSIAGELNLARVPAICVDYLEDERIEVDVWPASKIESLTKQQVIEMCLSGNVFPPKTSRHTIADHLPPIHVSLEVLEQHAPTQLD